ncbi:MAG TPA: prolyl oligopeptidase family serine peptidase [Pirellulales bacterium]|nr:prolyl oligopeptidase family serine peptidase [Pirellulales bacterium]
MKTLLAILELLGFCSLGVAEEVTKLYEARTYSADSPAEPGKKLTFPYRLLKPAHIEPGKLYPVVLFLHGAGERGDDNVLQLKYLPTWLASDENRQKYPCFVIAPQCASEKKWADVDWSQPDAVPAREMTDPMRGAIGILNEVVAANPVDKQRIYLTGLSMGGYGSWWLAEEMPERFAALVAVCGGGDESRASRLAKLPIWAWHGDADTAVPVERSRRMVAAIERAGGKPKYTELKGIGHDSWTPAYHGENNALAWLFEQRKP